MFADFTTSFELVAEFLTQADTNKFLTINKTAYDQMQYNGEFRVVCANIDYVGGAGISFIPFDKVAETARRYKSVCLEIGGVTEDMQRQLATLRPTKIIYTGLSWLNWALFPELRELRIKDVWCTRRVNYRFSLLKQCKELKVLAIDDTINIERNELEQLAELPALHEITAKGLRITNRSRRDTLDLNCLPITSELKTLNLPWTDVVDLAPLTRATGLQTLNIQGIPASVLDLTPLSSLFNLRELDIQHTNVYDFTPLSGLKKLKQVYK